jgi:hypothetical protein
MRTPRKKRWLFSFIVLAGTLLCAEAVARVVLERSPHPVVASANPRVIYELNPSYPGINSLGMRRRRSIRRVFAISS